MPQLANLHLKALPANLYLLLSNLQLKALLSNLYLLLANRRCWPTCT
jgi:hypothetical protein